MSDLERKFLRLLAEQPQGRLGYSRLQHTRALEEFSDLISGGFVIERQLGFHPGFQITSKGRERLGGVND